MRKYKRSPVIGQGAFLVIIKPSMSAPAILTLIITVLVAILIITDRFRPDFLALAVLVAIGLAGLVNPDELFSGFSSSPVITLIGISIISEGLHQTGFPNRISRLLTRLGGTSEKLLVLWVIIISAGLSLFMNNIAAVGILLPAVMTLSRSTRIAPGRLLMPLSYGTLLGGMATLLTTSNIIASGALREAGYAGFSLLDFLPIGIPVILVGTLYLVTIGRKLLPAPPADDAAAGTLSLELSQVYHLSECLAEIEVLPHSPFAGKTLHDSSWNKQLDMNVLGIVRTRSTILAPKANETVKPGDRLIVQGYPPAEVLEISGLRRVAPQMADITDDTISLAEVVITPRSSLIGKTLQEMEFRTNYSLSVIAIWRSGKPVTTDVAQLRLQFGDALLVHGAANRIRALRSNPDLLLLKDDPDAAERPAKTAFAVVITLFTLILTSLNIIPVALAVMAGAVLMFATGCIKPGEAYRSMEWKAIFLIAGMWPLSIAIRTSGLAELIVNSIGLQAGVTHPLLAAGILIILALIFTQFMSGQVSALVLSPIALAAAAQTGADVQGLVMAVALGCSLGFLTPFGHPVNLMIMGPGGYRFKDFVRVGGPLTIMLIAVILVGLALFWNLG